MSNKPKIYGTCKAGCQWETVHKDDFEKSASHIVQYPQEDGSYLLEIGKEYKIFAPKTADGTAFDCVLKINEGTDYEANLETPCNDTFADSFVFKALGFKSDGEYFIYEYSGIRYIVKSVLGLEKFKVSGATKVLLYNADATITAENGKSAYEIAVEHGFEGTEQEWLETFTHGADGKTPYIKDGNWWIGDTDTGVKAEGKKGDTYTLTETDQTEIAAKVVEMLGGNPIFGIVDENNNIILSGNLADGDYTVKYEMEDGSTVGIGNLVLDTNVYYSVTNNLTNCTNNNNITEVTEGESYSATISANSGYEIYSINVTMGGIDITSTAVNGNNINIANVTGNIVITAVAEETAVEITNWIEEVGYTTGKRLSLSSGGETTSSATDYECTGFIPAKYGDELYIENVDLTSENATNIIFYDSAKNPLAVNTAKTQYGTQLNYLFVTKGTQTGAGYSTAIVAEGSIEALPTTVEFIRIGSKSITSESVLNIKRNGVWL